MLKIKRMLFVFLFAIFLTLLALGFHSTAYADDLGYTVSGEGYYNGYVAAPEDSEYLTVTADETHTVSLNEEDNFIDEIQVEIGPDGPVDYFYVKDESGTVGDAVYDYVEYDETSPIITSVNTTVLSSPVYIKNHGIYTNNDAELMIEISAVDDGSGVKSLSLYGTDGDDVTTKYEEVSTEREGDTIKSTFLIEKKADMLKSLLRVKTRDNVGNESALTLIEEDEDKSTLTIEDKVPQIGDITISGKKKNDWYSEVPEISLDVEDEESGISSIKLIINEQDTIYEETFDEKVTSYKVKTAFGGEDTEEAEEYIKEHEKEAGGIFTGMLMVTDNSGNISSKEVTVKVELNDPVITVTGVKNNDKLKKAPEITIKSNDIHSDDNTHIMHIDIYKNEEKDVTQNISGKAEYTITPELFKDDAEYTLTAYIEGISGRKSNTEEIEFIKDSTIPSLTIAEPDPDKNEYGWLNKKITFVFNTVDPTSGIADVKATINGTPAIIEHDSLRYKTELTENLIASLINKDGTYTFAVTATDKAGNIATDSRTVKIDIVSPEVSISGITDGAYLGKEHALTITSDDANADKEGHKYSIEIRKNNTVVYDETIEAGASTIIEADTFSDDAKYTVTASATDPAGNKSEEKSISFTKDSEPPSIVIDKPDADENEYGWLNKPVTFTFNADDETAGINGLSATINGKSVEIESSGAKHSVALTSSLISSLINKDGTYTVTVTATDKTGNTVTESKTVKVDIVNPEVSISGITDGAYTDKGHTLTIMSNDANADKEGHKYGIEIKKNNAVIYDKTIEAGASTTIGADTFSDDAKYTVTAFATDPAGNKSGEKTVSFTKDSTPPSVVIDKPDADENEYGWLNKPVTFPFTVSDETAGVNAVSATINGKSVEVEGSGTNRSVELTSSLISSLINKDGTYVVTVTATDKTGNTITESKTVKVDIVKPAINISGIAEGAYLNVEHALVITSNDVNASREGHKYSIEIRRNNTAVYDETFEAGAQTEIKADTFFEDGKYTVTASAIDPAGNESEKVSLSFTKDSTPPLVSISRPDKDSNKYGWLNRPVTFTFNASDETAGIDSLSARINGKKVEINNKGTEYSVELTRELIANLINNAGTYELEVAVIDRSKNSASGSIKIKTDIVAPEIALSGIDEHAYLDKEHALTITSNDRNADKEGHRFTVSIKRNGETVYDKTIEDNAVTRINASMFSKDGKYTVAAYATDPADNKSKTKTLTFTKDSTPPEVKYAGVTGASINRNKWYNKPFTYNFTASDATSGIDDVKVSINGERVPYDRSGKKYSSELTRQLISSLINNSGTYEFKVLISDKSGNSRTIRNIYKVDIVKPVLSIKGIERNKHYRTTPALSISTNERFYRMSGAYINVNIVRDKRKVSSKKYTDLNSFKTSDFTVDGDYTVTVTETDAAGNTAVPQSISFVKDSTKPVITISGANRDSFYNRTVTPKVTVKERYYKTNKVTVKVTRELNGRTANLSFPFASAGEISSHSQSYSTSGKYVITVNAKDEAGNVADIKTTTFKVDVKKPEITITGVSKGSIYGYDDVVAPVITYKDDYPDKHTVTVTKAGTDVTNKMVKSDTQTRTSFSDFAKDKKNDGPYIITAKATDKAGNNTTTPIEFYVNRYGSGFRYSDDVEEYNNAYVQNVELNLHVEEFNVSKLVSTRNILKRDGETVSTTNTFKNNGISNGYKSYIHTFDNGDMEDEGIYTIDVISKDAAGNTSESAKEAGDVRFVVDRTKPAISLDGLDKLQNKGKSLTFSVNATDTLSPVKVKVEVNGRELKAKDKNVYVLKEGVAQKVVITARDKAGNTRTVDKTVTVTTNSALYVASKYGMPIAAAVLLSGLIGALAFAFIRGKKNKHDM